MANDEWRTPEWVWKPYGPFDLDAAATAENSLAPRFITKEMDAFETNWLDLVPRGSKVWCNPPYSKEAGPLERWAGLLYGWGTDFHIFALFPADTSTKWFHFLWDQSWYLDRPAVGVNFLKRRVRHIDPTTGKPGGSPKFGSLIVEFIP